MGQVEVIKNNDGQLQGEPTKIGPHFDGKYKIQSNLWIV